VNAPPPAAVALRKLMGEHDLTQRDVAELACVHIKTVEAWLADTKSASFRRMPGRHLNLIRAMLPGFLAAKRGRKN
jgi:hypothetical protein